MVSSGLSLSSFALDLLRIETKKTTILTCETVEMFPSLTTDLVSISIAGIVSIRIVVMRYAVCTAVFAVIMSNAVKFH